MGLGRPAEKKPYPLPALFLYGYCVKDKTPCVKH